MKTDIQSAVLDQVPLKYEKEEASLQQRKALADVIQSTSKEMKQEEEPQDSKPEVTSWQDMQKLFSYINFNGSIQSLVINFQGRVRIRTTL